MEHPQIRTFQLIQPEKVPELINFIRSHSTEQRGSGAAGDEQNVLREPDGQLWQLVKDLASHITTYANEQYLDTHVCWHGSIREWQQGEYSDSHYDCYDESPDGDLVLMEAPAQNVFCDLAAILYLHDSEDGRLIFDDLAVEYAPRAGECVVFPSTVRHRVSEVTGERLTICHFLSRARTIALGANRMLAGWGAEMYDASPAIALL